jgi:hypothetical protein
MKALTATDTCSGLLLSGSAVLTTCAVREVEEKGGGEQQHQ